MKISDLYDELNETTEPQAAAEDSGSRHDALVMRLKQQAVDLAPHKREVAVLLHEAIELLEQTAMDSDRLDFLQSLSVNIDDMVDTERHGRAVIFCAPYEGDRPPTLREAIDKAVIDLYA